MRPAAQGAWSTGLCECCADPGGCSTCCYAYWCPCCQYGQNVQRMPKEVCCGTSCCGACCCYCLMLDLGLCCFLHCGARGWLRRKYSLPGDPCQDCCIALCCAACALCQEHRELTIRHLQPGGKEMAVATNQVKPVGAAAAAPVPMMMMPQPVAQPAAPPQAYPPQPQPYAAPPQVYAPPPQAYAPQQAFASPPPPQVYSQPYAQPYSQPYAQPYAQPVYIQPQGGYGNQHRRRGSRSGSDSD